MASDIFAKIGDFKGESLDSKHRVEFEVLSWSWRVTQTGSISQAPEEGRAKASLHDFNVTHHIDKASPLLLNRG